MTDHDDDVPEPTDREKGRWQTSASEVREMFAGLRDGTATQQVVHGTLDRLASPDIDRDTLINAVHVPPDAGPYAPALERILRRIPDGFAGDHDRVPARVVVSVDR
jgi:hypothetical protein